MWYAGLDTSGPTLQVAAVSLSREGSLIWSQYSSNKPGSHHEEIVEGFDRCRVTQGLEWRNLGAIVLASGPGSFTGLRIGFGFAKGIAFARNIPILPFSSHEAAAHLIKNTRAQGQTSVAVIWSDARRGEFFSSIWNVTPERVTRLIAPSILSERELALAVNEQQSTGILVEGLALDNSRFENQPSITIQEPHIAEGLLLTAGSAFGGLAQLLCSGSKPRFMTAAELASLQPLYIREAAAKKISERTPAIR